MIVKICKPNLGGPLETAPSLWTGRAAGQRATNAHDLRMGTRQYLVIRAGGHGKMKRKMGDAVVAFRLE